MGIIQSQVVEFSKVLIRRIQKFAIVVRDLNPSMPIPGGGVKSLRPSAWRPAVPLACFSANFVKGGPAARLRVATRMLKALKKLAGMGFCSLTVEENGPAGGEYLCVFTSSNSGRFVPVF